MKTASQAATSMAGHPASRLAWNKAILGIKRDVIHVCNGHTLMYCCVGMGMIQELAFELKANERTLRRAVEQGTILARRSRPRRLRLDSGELGYLRRHWQLLSHLRHALRTERRVRLAVLYGSMARGDEDVGSDLDLLVSLTDDRPAASHALASRLERVAGRKVDLARLERVERDAPLLLAQVLAEGRVLIDRDRQWPRLRERRRAIRARADRAYRRQMEAGGRAIEELVG